MVGVCFEKRNYIGEVIGMVDVGVDIIFVLVVCLGCVVFFKI